MDELAQELSPAIIKDEKALQLRLAEHPELLGDGFWTVGYEFGLDPGSVDILAIDGDGRLVVIEVKRDSAARDAVGQALDYVSALDLMDPLDIAHLISTRQLPSAVPPVTDFEAAYADRYPNAELSDLTPARVLLASTSALPTTRRIVSYLRGYGLDIDIALEGEYEEDSGKSDGRQRPGKPAQPRGESASPDTTSSIADTRSIREPCRSATQRQDTKGRRKIEDIHERAKGYPGVELFWSIHCLILDALSEAHEIPRTEHDRKKQEQCGIALTMPSTPEDEEGGRLEYVVIRLYPVAAGEIEIFVYDRAAKRAGDVAARLNTLPKRSLYLGKDRRVGVDDRNFWFTAETWPRHQADFEAVLHAIHKGWKAEWEAGRE